MLKYITSINDTKIFDNLKIFETSPIMKLIVRGKSREFISSVGKSLNILLPNEPNTSSSGTDVTALWLSPDEWIIYANEINSDDSNSYIIESELISKISRSLEELGQSEISTNTIGTMVMEGLKDLDPVAYVRFASVYRNFREEKDFVQFVDKIDVYKKR